MYISDKMNEDYVLKPVVDAIQKAITEDFPNYCLGLDLETNNHRLLLRGDLVNDNLRHNLNDENLFLLRFDRFGWKARLVVDRIFKRVFCICTENTINRLKTKGQNYPHFSQTLVKMFNKDLLGKHYQFELFLDEFSPQKYKEDMAILEESGVLLEEGFHFYYIVYSVEKGVINNIRLLLLDNQFTVVEERTLIDLLSPEYSMVSIKPTAVDTPKTEVNINKLLTMKNGVKPTLIKHLEEGIK